ncbi:Uncharacterised protein [Streptomyces griseus]|nr:hypothetical protein SAMN04490359_7101 [Streptomyces griseus]SQA23929.1 Uncharacterised protein [Streptomyces griseus]
MAQSLSSFTDLIRSAERSAVHLEMRDVYAVPNENEQFAAWRQGHQLDPDDRDSWWRPWLDVVQEITAKGVRIRRARIAGARTAPSDSDIRAWCEACGAGDQATDQIGLR